MTPYFEYSPVKVTFKKKVRLRDLTPEKEDKALTRWNIFCLFIGFIINLGLICIVAYFGNKYDW